MGKKKPRIQPGFRPSTKKQPAIAKEPDPKNRTVQWCFQLFDNDACWHEETYAEESFRLVASLLKDYSGRTWGQIQQNHKRDHPVKVTHLIPEAQKRLETLQLGDYSELWRFRFSGLRRIWGIRNGHVFRVLWWDPQHAVCPSTKDS